jgi:hypothetical protein
VANTKKKTETNSKSESKTPQLTSLRALRVNREPLIFISHDSRDWEVAEAFSELLKNVSVGMLKTFRSSDKKGTEGIEFGDEWFQRVMSRLGDASVIIALLTPQSLNRPWILYETGVAKGKTDTKAIGLALGVSATEAYTGPFSQFQNCGDDKESLTKLIKQLLEQHLPEASPSEKSILAEVEDFQAPTKELVKAQQTHKPKQDHENDSSTLNLFQEIKVMIRNLEEKMNERSIVISNSSTSRSNRGDENLAEAQELYEYWLTLIEEVSKFYPSINELAVEVQLVLLLSNDKGVIIDNLTVFQDQLDVFMKKQIKPFNAGILSKLKEQNKALASFVVTNTAQWLSYKRYLKPKKFN